MKLIVGLGNPGSDYVNTRHNMGFMVIDNYAKLKNVSFEKEKFGGTFTELFVNNEKILLLKPLKFINLSGEVLSSFVSYFKISISDILVISDDLDMPLGKIKLKENSSSGGHNGLKNIEKCLGTKSYKRLKLGISNNKNIDTKDYVLGRFSSDDLIVVKDVIDKSCKIIDDFINSDFNFLMNKYNNK